MIRQPVDVDTAEEAAELRVDEHVLVEALDDSCDQPPAVLVEKGCVSGRSDPRLFPLVGQRVDFQVFDTPHPERDRDRAQS
jgi:hypothetical protein